MRHKKIKDVFTIIYKGRQRVGFEVEGIEKYIFLSPGNVKQCTDIGITEVEILIGSTIRPELYKEGEKLPNGKLYESKYPIIKDFWIECSGNKDEMRNLNKSRLINFKTINKAFHFNRNGRDSIGFDVGEDKAIFTNAKSVTSRTQLDISEIHILEGSYISPIYWQKGENVYEGMSHPAELCKKSDVLIKDLRLRLYGKVEEMHERFETTEPNYYTSDNHNSYEPSYDTYGGPHGFDDDTIDTAFEGDADNIWNIL
ncbi:hypothetical protein [Algibacter sp. 2305UL17-15]|uniref:hypothetical protein n=1 Tax=Algibacter sp. 2305UL17-15 TaxID=3231268 RepID=UPI003457BD92